MKIKRKKVFHLIESSETGGAETVFWDLCCNMNTESIQYHIGLLYKGWLYDEIKKQDKKWTKFKTNGSFDIGLLKQLVNYIKTEKIDIIHSHLFGMNVYASLSGKICGIPSISCLHGISDVNQRDKLKRIKFVLMNSCSERVVYVSNYLMNHFLDRKFCNKRKSTIIYNGIDIDRFNNSDIVSIRDELRYQESDIIIGAVGDIRPPKGYNVLLKSAKLLSEKVPKIKFIVAGTKTPLLEMLLQMRNDLGLNNVVNFLGYRKDVPSIFKSIDIYILPSISEGFSLTTVEAMASGTPVVATKSGGPEEIITDSKDGILIEKNNPYAIEKAITKLLSNPRMKKEMITEAKRTVADKFSLNTMVNNYLKLYDELY